MTSSAWARAWAPRSAATGVYTTAGYAQVGTDSDTIDVGSSDGYLAGAGYKRLIAPNLSVGAETLYHGFGDFDEAPGVDATATTIGF